MAIEKNVVLFGQLETDKPVKNVGVMCFNKNRAG
nr:MAG TPA: hypothetical protein [Caudoviricetes sp.]